MAGLTINVRDTATPVINRVLDGIAPEKINPILARAAVNTTRDHLFRLNGERANQLGGKRTNFYAQAARGTSYELRSNGFAVGISQVGIRQRLFGGTITPKGDRKYLTIPMRAEAYGHRAREFDNLRFAIVERIGPALVQAGASLIRKMKAGFKRAGEIGGAVMFRLVRKVTQQPDPSVIPSRQAYIAALGDTARSYLARLTQRRG